jgi:CYTH domain-containing protein
MREIERKFLVRQLPDLSQCAKYDIEQGYLATELGRSEVRLRRCNEEQLLTVKRDRADGENVHSREEVNVPLVQSQWETLWKMTEGRRVTKTRYEVPLGNRTVEIDVFTGANAGVITAEVEFPDPEASRAFTPPDWLGEEITRRPEYSNWQLAG